MPTATVAPRFRSIRLGGDLLSTYRSVPEMTGAVAVLERRMAALARALAGRRLWIVNSTQHGGGVAEMLTRQVRLLQQGGIDARWLVFEPGDPAYFALTKRLHNLLHAPEGLDLTDADRRLYARVAEAGAAALAEHVRPGDALVVHDPQPLGAGGLVARQLGLTAIWRCHVGHPVQTTATRTAWSFLRDHLTPFRRTVFSAASYVPDFLVRRSAVIAPAIDPTSPKNRDLAPDEIDRILAASGVIPGPAAAADDPDRRAAHLQTDGRFGPSPSPAAAALGRLPTILQISRWDGFKGFDRLIDGFRCFQEARGGRHGGQDGGPDGGPDGRLILAGPDPGHVADDPEATRVLDGLVDKWLNMPSDIRAKIALINLPLSDPDHNALIVNALQRRASVVAQMSVREGFGLTATEAMWKGRPILATAGTGVAAQVRNGREGLLIEAGAPPPALAGAIGRLAASAALRERLGMAARQRVAETYLVADQMCQWIDLLHAAVAVPDRGRARPATV